MGKKPISATIDEELISWIDSKLKDKKNIGINLILLKLPWN